MRQQFSVDEGVDWNTQFSDDEGELSNSPFNSGYWGEERKNSSSGSNITDSYTNQIDVPNSNLSRSPTSLPPTRLTESIARFCYCEANKFK